MYSRYHDRAVRVPENYSGTAFSDTLSPKESATHRLDVAKPTPLPATDEREPPTMPPPPRTLTLPPKPHDPPPPPAPIDAEQKEKREHTPTPLPLQGLLGNLGHAFPFSHGLGFDELLLLGLILLLSQSGEGSDLVLWLALLLFCG